MKVEKMGIPTAPVITTAFVELVKGVVYKAGMPHLRFTFAPHPIAGKTPAQLREIALGNDPESGKPLLDSIVAALTRPLTAEEKKKGVIERPVPKYAEGDSEDQLQQYFLEQGWTDGMPVILPTEEKVRAMLKGTSHKPEEVIGKMRPNPNQEPWEYTVEKVAINAVMAGAKPEHLPVILALAASQETAIHSSTSSFANMVVVNGPIRNQIGMNAGLGVLGPFNHANTAIGRAYTLLSRNLGAAGQPGVTYMGTQGNPLNSVGLVFAENEERSPWEPFHVSKGFKPDESTVSIFRGRHFVFLLDVREKTWREQFRDMVSGINAVHNAEINVTLLLDPQVAATLHDREKFATKRQLAQWYHENCLIPYEVYWDNQMVINYILPRASKGEEPYKSYLAQPKDSMIRKIASPDLVNVIVAGGGTNAYWNASDFGYITTLSVDKWR